MCQVRFIGCLHLGHTSVARYRGFQDEFYHDEHLIQQWNETVDKKDLTYIVGDVTMETSKWYFRLDELNGRKIVVLGNHDKPRDIPELLKYVDGVAGAVDYKGFMITHVPIHPNEIHFYHGNIHAHIHHVNKLEEITVSNSYLDAAAVPKPTLHKYFNVDANLIGFRPKSLDELYGNKCKECFQIGWHKANCSHKTK